MLFPYGEWIILFLVVVTWTEKRASRRFFLMLTIAWLVGKCLEEFFPSATPWHWHFAHLAVMLVFWRWAWQHSKQRFLPLFLSSVTLSMETLFLVNEPGVFPYESELLMIVLILISWLTAKSYWGTAAAFVGSVLLNQALVRFTYEGIVRHADLPDSFVWNFGVSLFAVWAGLRLGWIYYTERVKAYEHSEERELQ